MEKNTQKSHDHEFPRRYVASEALLDNWPAAEKYYRELAERPITSVTELEQWLLDFSEIDAIFDEQRVSRHVALAQTTDDAERERRYLDFIENVFPLREPWHQKLREKFLECVVKYPLPPKRYEVLERGIRNALELYREENIPLMVENAKLVQQYQKITGAMTVVFRGEELTLQQLGRFLEEPDRKLRAESWRLGADRFLRDAPDLDEVYERMVRLRHRMALNADCANFRDFAFRIMERFDYTPADCLDFHEAIERVVCPAARQLARERQDKLGVESLRPWDMQVDAENRPPLRPFETAEQLMDGCGRIFNRVDRELGRVFEVMREARRLDLESRKGKAPGGFQETYSERRMPFIFMNAVGTESDVRTLLHEGGHAFHTWACRQDPLDAYRSAPIEFAEVGSMGMELLALPHVDEFYGAEANRARRTFLEGIVNFFPYMACVDALQHWVYTHVEATPEERKDEWARLVGRFMGHVDWSGLETYCRHSWQRKLHFFEVPFYYVEYGIAQLGALQVWMNSKQDYAQAVALYRNGLALGGARPLPELFAAAGLKFDFTEKTLRPLIEQVMEEIEKL